MPSHIHRELAFPWIEGPKWGWFAGNKNIRGRRRRRRRRRIRSERERGGGEGGGRRKIRRIRRTNRVWSWDFSSGGQRLKIREWYKGRKVKRSRKRRGNRVGLVSKANHVSSSSGTKRKGGWLAGWLAEAVVSRIRMVRSPYNGHSSDLKSVS
ncbi:hypothetical protein V1478_001399 [Vespula squamosa]|uniref:Uncharacterized protein n=1 Tax=Vespula squamosa TaxID=30214 RepID=A0ABD2C1C2_VESSQ